MMESMRKKLTEVYTKMGRIVVFKKWRPSEGRIFGSERLANAFISRVKRAGGAKLMKVRIKK